MNVKLRCDAITSRYSLKISISNHYLIPLKDQMSFGGLRYQASSTSTSILHEPNTATELVGHMLQQLGYPNHEKDGNQYRPHEHHPCEYQLQYNAAYEHRHCGCYFNGTRGA